MVYITHPDDSFKYLEEMRRSAETLLERLELPYRTITLCAGDREQNASKNPAGPLLSRDMPRRKAFRSAVLNPSV